MRVESYWNLHKHVFSIRALEGEQQGRVIEHVSHKTLHDVTFAVQPAGRAKVLREQRKNVHAFVRGTTEGLTAIAPASEWEKISYNPYKNGQFVNENGHPVTHAECVKLTTTNTGRACIVAWKCH